MRISLTLCSLVVSTSVAHAISGGAVASREIAAQTVMIVSTRGASCSAVVIARDLLLTAAHCVQPKSDYAVALLTNGVPRVIPLVRIMVHPQYDPSQFESRKPSPDIAIVKIGTPLPSRYMTAKLSSTPTFPKHGEAFVLAGFGFERDGDERSAGTLRSVKLLNIGSTGNSMIRVSAGNRNTAGACTGDSGGPAFHGGELAGVIGWTSVPAGKNCGSITGLTLVGFQLPWIEQTVQQLK